MLYLSENIRALRRAKELTQEEVAAADKTAGLLPHRRESREEIRAVIAGQPDAGEIDSYLRWLLLGE